MTETKRKPIRKRFRSASPRRASPRWSAPTRRRVGRAVEPRQRGASHELLVACPRCQGKAVIVGVEDRRGPALRLWCSGCDYSLRREAAVWFGPAVGHARTECRACGRMLESRIRSLGAQRLSAFTRVTCDDCWALTETLVTWRFGPADDTEAHDPIFGLPLLLQAPCCGERLWASNLAELDRIETLVRGRRRAAPTTLAPWMTRRENRGPVLAVISALRRYVD